jgi:eukaryotic-like serine/threonine-protein kinase
VQEWDAAQGTLPSGFQFGAYVIGSCIGQGGMARIYRAEHRVLRKPVALKVMESVLLERPDGRPRFLREGQAAAAVKHPNVVDITDVGVWQGRPYLVMELLEGEDLEAYLARHKPLAEQDVARVMIPVIAGLVTAHIAGVIHRDLKPSNIFLSRGPDGEVVPKLLDFGISKLANTLRSIDPSSTPLGELMGSPMYMSPEAVRGARDLTPQSDQYSLGVILYECITGRPPFYGDSLLSVLEAVAHGQYESPRRFRPELSTVLEVAILRAMSREPSDRYPSVRELGRALCEAADQRTRLLWTPSFGLRDAPLNRSTASLGSGPMRTGSALSASVSKSSRRTPLWQLGLSAFALLMVALVVVAYSRMPRLQTRDGQPQDGRPQDGPNAHPAAAGEPLARGGFAVGSRLAGQEAPASVATSPLSPSPAPASAPPAPAGSASPAPAASGPGAAAAPPVAANKPAATRSAAARRRTREVAAEPPEPKSAPGETRAPVAAKPAGQAEGASTVAGSDEGPADDEIVFPVRLPAPARPATMLGANQSPILD